MPYFGCLKWIWFFLAISFYLFIKPFECLSGKNHKWSLMMKKVNKRKFHQFTTNKWAKVIKSMMIPVVDTSCDYCLTSNSEELLITWNDLQYMEWVPSDYIYILTLTFYLIDLSRMVYLIWPCSIRFFLSRI